MFISSDSLLVNTLGWSHYKETPSTWTNIITLIGHYTVGTCDKTLCSTPFIYTIIMSDFWNKNVTVWIFCKWIYGPFSLLFTICMPFNFFLVPSWSGLKHLIKIQKRWHFGFQILKEGPSPFYQSVWLCCRFILYSLYFAKLRSLSTSFVQ